jgi:hypothetical protein
MKTRFITMAGLLLLVGLVGLLAAGCAQPTTYPAHMEPRPFYNDTWWGTDPVCSPGCPPGAQQTW